MSSNTPKPPSFVPLPAGCLAKMGRQYAPFTIRNSFALGTINSNGLEIAENQEVKSMQNFFEMEQFKMYGSPEELWDQVKVFGNFQGNNKYFGLDSSIHYSHTFRTYQELRKEREYVLKNDIFLYIQNFLIEKEPLLKVRLVLIMLSYFFKSQEKKLNDTCEFVLFEKEKFKKLDQELKNLLIDIKSIRLPASGFNWKKVFKKFQKLLPVEMTESEMSALTGVLKHLFSMAQTTRQQSENVAILSYTFCAKLIPGLEKILNSRPEWFMPNSRLDSKKNSQRAVVRMIVDDNAGFITARELESVLKPYLKCPWQAPAAGFVDVLEGEIAIKIWEQHGRTLEQIDFVLFPTTRTKHCFVPIPTGSGLFCKPAAEVLIELLRDFFFGSNIFQNPSKKTSEAIVSMFGEFEFVFNPTVEEIHLLDERMIDNLTKVSYQKIRPVVNPKMIRDVSSKGFTAEDVKKELKYLTVDVFFLDVCEHANVVYDNVNSKKKGKVLRTCDMYDAVEGCMLLSVFKRFPKMATFLHGHKSCFRIPGLHCEKCIEEKKNPKKKQHYITMGCGDDRKNITTILKVDIFDQNSKPIQKDLTKPTPLPKPVIEPKPKKEKVPITCEKCIRTGERTLKVKEVLKISKSRVEDIETEMNSIKCKIEISKKREAEIQKIIEKKYGDKLSILEKESEELKVEGQKSIEKIKFLEKELVDKKKEFEASKKWKIGELEKAKLQSDQMKERLQSEHLRLKTQNADMDQTIAQLTAQLEALPPPSSPHSVASEPSPSSLEINRKTLENLHKIRRNLTRDDPIAKVRTTVGRLIMLADEENVKNSAKYELDRIIAEFNIYTRVIDENIEKIQRNAAISPSKLEKVPDRPQFSRNFIEEYRRLTSRENNENDELANTECVICLENISSKVFTVKCEGCKRRYHSECASKWLKQKSTCKMCDRKMLHPADYPSLF